MKSVYYSAQVIVRTVSCENCGNRLEFVKSDFSKPELSWLHKCVSCEKKYWLDNRYPVQDFLVDYNNPLDISCADVKGISAKDDED